MRRRLLPLIALVCVALTLSLSLLADSFTLLVGAVAWPVPGSALRAQQPSPGLPAVPVLPAIPPELTRAITGGLDVVVRDISFSNARFRVRVPYLRTAGGSRGGGSLRLSLVHVRGAEVTSTASDVVVPIDLFTKLTDQRIDVARVLVENSAITRRHRAGGVQWYARDIDIDVRDIAIGGARAEQLRLVRADGAGAVEDNPVVLRSLTALVRRDLARGRFAANGDARLAASHMTLDATVVRRGPATIAAFAETTDFGDFSAFADGLPRAGSGVVDVQAERNGGATTITVTRADAQLNESRVTARGIVRTGTGGRVDDVVVDVTRLTARDLDTAYGIELPGGGEVRGRVTADGPLLAGVQVDGVVHRFARQDSTLIRLQGLVRDTAGVRIDMYAHAEPVRAADTLFVVALRARGPLDSLVLNGDVTLARAAGVTVDGDADGAADELRDARAILDAHLVLRGETRVLRGTADVSATVTDRTTGAPARVSGDIAGVIALGKGGLIDADVRADSLPLRLIPAPDAVRDVSGVATGGVRITGTLDEPHWLGAVEVSGGGLRVQRYETVLAGLHGTIRIADDVVSTEGITGELGGGSLALAGSARVRGERTIDATLRLDRGRILDNDSLRATASAELRASGALKTPSVRGEVVVHEGHFDEDMLKEPAPIDVRDPPYADVAARVPWIRNSRLLPVDTAIVVRADPAARPDIAIALRVERDFRLIDEDSEMSGTGLILFTTDSAGVVADGSYRIERGVNNNFGERFRVQGGIFHFPGDGFRSRVSLRGRHDAGAPIGRDLGTDGSVLDFYPPLQSFAIGSLSGIKEEVRRLSLLPEQPAQLGNALLYREPTNPVTGWRVNRYWRPETGAGLTGARASAQSTPLLWAYTADELYDYIPLSKAYLRSGSVAVGPDFPGRMVVAGVIGGGLRSRAYELDVRQPLEGTTWPGVQLRYDTGAWRLSAFHEPRFHAWPAGGADARGFVHVRRNGVRVLWRTEW